MKQFKNIAIVGATGAVGLELLAILKERRFPIRELRLFASARSKDRWISFNGKRVKVQGLKTNAFKGIDIAFFTAGGAISKTWVPKATREGAIVIDNTSAFRMHSRIPLVVPEVNPQTLKGHKSIIANPNCSTIQLVMALKPLHDYGRIKRVLVTTLQAVSGAGLKATNEMEAETRARLSKQRFNRKIFPHQIAFNAIPQIPQKHAFANNDYTLEEIKMIRETRKILGIPALNITATCTRIPVYRGHSESVNIQTTKPITPAQARSLLAKARGIKVVDQPGRQRYPTATWAAGKDEIFVGRIRKDKSALNALNLWIVSDNLRKGAALNAIQIAEYLIKNRRL